MGLDNPHSANPRCALHPRPKGASGSRLQKMSGLSESEYLRRFDRRNVSTHGTTLPENATVVLLGDAVRQRFGLKKLLILPQVKDGRTFRQIPHPSGRCLAYNDPVFRDLVGMMLRSL